MEFMTTKEAVQKWNISERRIRRLLQDGRIEGAVKVGNNWNIPINANKPADKRSVKLDNTEFKFDLPDNYFDKVDELNKELNSKRPISKETLKSLKESINLEWTYNSNGIEGNTLTLRETQVVLEGITVGGKSLKEHLEVINHEKAILFLDGHSSRLCPAAIDYFQRHNVTVIILPSHTTHILQPFDICISSPLKTCFKKMLVRWKNLIFDECNSESDRLRKITIISIIEAFSKTVTPFSSMQSFRKAGFGTIPLFGTF